MSDRNKWTDIRHLPEWDEEFYEVYSARKHGKGVMLKTLRPELRNNPAYKALIEKEFDVRYNLAHPHIVMINDFEDVPELGMSIITDDVYGDSLRKLIDSKQVDNDILDKITTQLVEAIAYIQTNHIVHHPIRPETIIFTKNVRNLKLIDVGFDQRENLSPADASEDIRNFGKILNEALDASDVKNQRLRKIANKCINGGTNNRFNDVHDLKLALSGGSNRLLYTIVIAFLAVMSVILGWIVVTNP